VVATRPERALFAAAGGRVGLELPVTDAFALRAELDVLAKASGAAALGLYEGAPGARTPLAVKLSGSIKALEDKEKALLQTLQAKTTKSAKQLDANLNQKLDDAKAKAIQKLGDRLVGRGPRLI